MARKGKCGKAACRHRITMGARPQRHKGRRKALPCLQSHIDAGRSWHLLHWLGWLTHPQPARSASRHAHPPPPPLCSANARRPPLSNPFRASWRLPCPFQARGAWRVLAAAPDAQGSARRCPAGRHWPADTQASGTPFPFWHRADWKKGRRPANNVCVRPLCLSCNLGVVRATPPAMHPHRSLDDCSPITYGMLCKSK